MYNPPVTIWISSGDLIYSVLVIVNYTVLYIWELLRVNLECSHHTKEIVILWHDGSVMKYFMKISNQSWQHTLTTRYMLCTLTTYLIIAGKNKQVSFQKNKKITSPNILSKGIAKAKEKVFMKYWHNILYKVIFWLEVFINTSKNSSFMSISWQSYRPDCCKTHLLR